MGVHLSRVRLVAIVLAVFQAAVAVAEKPRPEFSNTTGTIEKVVPVGVSTQIDLRPLLKDPNIPTTLQWLPTNPPSWVKITGDTMEVTPPTSSSTTFRLTVQNKPNPGEDADAGDNRFFKVVAANPPVWGDTDLGRWDEGKPLKIDLTKRASHPQNEKLTFSIENPSNNAGWLRVNGDFWKAHLSATILGKFDIVLVATTPLGLTAKKVGLGEVRKVAVAPKFLANPITLPDALEDARYDQGINKPAWVSVSEPEPITFEVTSGKPAWLTFSADGTMSGTPVRADVGAVTLNVILKQVVDGNTLSATTVVKFNVQKVNKAPKWSKDPIVLPDAPVKKLASHPLSSFASDIDGDQLTYRKVNGPAWGDVSIGGVFSGTPQNADIGQHEFIVQVTDGKLTADVRVQIKVFNTPPKWASDPVVLKNAKEDFDYLEDLRTKASDVDGDLLSFEKLSGPAWVTVSNDGKVTGNPKRADLGLNKMRVKVTDNISGTAEVEVQITVDRTNKAPRLVDEPH